MGSCCVVWWASFGTCQYCDTLDINDGMVKDLVTLGRNDSPFFYDDGGGDVLRLLTEE